MFNRKKIEKLEHRINSINCSCSCLYDYYDKLFIKIEALICLIEKMGYIAVDVKELPYVPNIEKKLEGCTLIDHISGYNIYKKKKG